MKTAFQNLTRSAAVLLCILLLMQKAVPQERPFGLGVILGEPTGLSAKAWTSSANAFDFGLGWSVGGDRIGKFEGLYAGGSRVHLHMDYLWHSWRTIRSSERFPLYYGIGGRLNSGAGYRNSLAARGVFGVAWMPRTAPVDVFIELVPSLQLLPATGFGLDAGLGSRYFF